MQELDYAIRSAENDVKRYRDQAIEAMQWLSRNLQEEATRVAEDPTRLPQTSLMSSSLVVDITRLTTQCQAADQRLQILLAVKDTTSK
jgi:hypothetical protein